MDIVNEVLVKDARNAEKYKPITVEKHLDVEFDLGTLLAIDSNDLDDKLLKKKREAYLLDLTRDNTQLLLNGLWELPTERFEEAIVAKLPAPTTVLPRARRVPKPRPLTKWEQFAKEKGIQNKKKTKTVFDETLQKWVPTYGFKRAAAQKDTEWVKEIPQNMDPMTDMFAKSASEKSERQAKNELQRLRNIARSTGGKVPRMGLPTTDKASSKQLSTAVTVAKASTASLGKFQAKLPKEKEARGIGVKQLIPGANRKRKSHISGKAEKSENLEVIKSILNKRPKMDIEKAVSRQINQEQSERADEKRNQKPKAGRGGKKKGRSTGLKGRGASKPKSARGERNPGKHSAGKKRR